MCRVAHDVGRVARRACKDFGYVDLSPRAGAAELRHDCRMLDDDGPVVDHRHPTLTREMAARIASGADDTTRADTEARRSDAGLYWS